MSWPHHPSHWFLSKTVGFLLQGWGLGAGGCAGSVGVKLGKGLTMSLHLFPCLKEWQIEVWEFLKAQ